MEMPAQMAQVESVTLPVLTVGRWTGVMAVLSTVSLLGVVLCLHFGSEPIPFPETARILFEGPKEIAADSSGVNHAVIIFDVRLPRVLLAFLVGASLTAVGVSLQALLRNPLADPYILGISSGAALGAAMAMQLGLTWAAAGFSTLQLCAFLGAGVTILAVHRIAVADGRIPVHTLLLAGVIANAILSSLILFMSSLADSTSAFRLFFWLMGSLATMGYEGLGALTICIVLGMVLLWVQARNLNLLSLGEDTARGLGLEVERTKRVIFFTSALMTGAVVAVSGLIGFVGMVVPHAVRMVLGPDHRLLLPAGTLVGGLFLMAADTVARTVLAPTELPVGVITALCGGPFFIYLLACNRRVQLW